MNTSTEGKVRNRAETLAVAKATKYQSVEYPDVKVTVFGDTAIATGGFKGKGTDESGKPFDSNELLARVRALLPCDKPQPKGYGAFNQRVK